jgi:hypothetical protein
METLEEILKFRGFYEKGPPSEQHMENLSLTIEMSGKN